MQTQQIHLVNNQWITQVASPNFDAAKSQLAIVFGSGDLASSQVNFESIKLKFPNASIVSCSNQLPIRTWPEWAA